MGRAADLTSTAASSFLVPIKAAIAAARLADIVREVLYWKREGLIIERILGIRLGSSVLCRLEKHRLRLYNFFENQSYLLDWENCGIIRDKIMKGRSLACLGFALLMLTE